MAWVRRVRTASGATAVQIAESVGGRRRIVRHVGSARDEATLGLLMQQARDLLEDDLQGVLDLGMQVPQRATRLVPAPTEPVLFGGQPALPRPAVAPARVMRTSSRLLYDTLAAVFDGLGFGVVGDDCFRDLVIARIVEPSSLLDVDRVLAELGRTSASLSTRKRTLRRAHSGAYRDQIAEACSVSRGRAEDSALIPVISLRDRCVCSPAMTTSVVLGGDQARRNRKETELAWTLVFEPRWLTGKPVAHRVQDQFFA